MLLHPSCLRCVTCLHQPPHNCFGIGTAKCSTCHGGGDGGWIGPAKAPMTCALHAFPIGCHSSAWVQPYSMLLVQTSSGCMHCSRAAMHHVASSLLCRGEVPAYCANVNASSHLIYAAFSTAMHDSLVVSHLTCIGKTKRPIFDARYACGSSIPTSYTL
jgi:hypothetical protein